jgi:uncharacterized protein
VCVEGDCTFFHVMLTTECNLQCRYCFGEALEDVDTNFPDFKIDYSLPNKISYDVDLLDNFCRRDPDCVLTFYGGEPLLCIDEIKLIMNNVQAKHFMIQTNGLLLDQLESKYVNRFHTILVSIDGDEALTDFYRGKGVFRKVINNLRLIKQNGFHGELIARMTVMEQTDIYNQVLWLLNNETFPFASVHWQLNAGFWKDDYKRNDFKKWSVESYNVGVRKLAKFWVDHMEKTGVVLKLYPFLGIAQSLLNNEKHSSLRCGAGWINYAIQTDGHIIPCPCMWGIKDQYLEHISHVDPSRLKKVYVDKPCKECESFPLCGGRCLYANVTKRWSPEAYGFICKTVQNLIEAISEQLPKIQNLITTGKIHLQDFEYMKYNGCEIIP